MKKGIQIVVSGVVGGIVGAFLGAAAVIFLQIGEGMGDLLIASVVGMVLSGILMNAWRVHVNAEGLNTNPHLVAIREVMLWMVMGFVLGYFLGGDKLTEDGYHQIRYSPLVSAIFGVVVGMGTIGGISVWRFKNSFSYTKAVLASAIGMGLQPFLSMLMNPEDILVGALLGGGGLFLVGMAWQRLWKLPFGKVAASLLTLLFGRVLFGWLNMVANSMATNGSEVFIPDPMAILQVGVRPLVGIPLMMYGLSWLIPNSREVVARNGQDSTA